MNKFQKIEVIFKNTCMEFVENNKTASQFVAECDESLAALTDKIFEYSSEGAECLFDSKEAFKVYRNKQKKAWELVKTIRKE